MEPYYKDELFFWCFFVFCFLVCFFFLHLFGFFSQMKNNDIHHNYKECLLVDLADNSNNIMFIISEFILLLEIETIILKYL